MFKIYYLLEECFKVGGTVDYGTYDEARKDAEHIKKTFGELASNIKIVRAK